MTSQSAYDALVEELDDEEVEYRADVPSWRLYLPDYDLLNDLDFGPTLAIEDGSGNVTEFADEPDFM